MGIYERIRTVMLQHRSLTYRKKNNMEPSEVLSHSSVSVAVPNKKAFTVSEFCEVYSIGKTLAYQEIKEGRLKKAKIGKRTLIPAKSAEEWLQQALLSAGGVA